MKFFIKPLPPTPSEKTKSVFFAKVRDVSLELQPTRKKRKTRKNGIHASYIKEFPESKKFNKEFKKYVFG